jgi:uncharacterized protein (DUF302 family)
MDIDGLTTVRSPHSPKETMDRLEAAVKAKGMTVFARIDHAAGAAEAGLTLRHTKLLIFGNARGGTPLMQAVQTMAIDLPLKAFGLAGRFGRYLAVVERAAVARATTRSGLSNRCLARRHECRPRGAR